MDQDGSVPNQRRPEDGPIPGLSAVEAARILGVHPSTVANSVCDGVLAKAVKWQRNGLDRGAVVNLALERYTPRNSWFVATREAAEMLGVSRVRLVMSDQCAGLVAALKDAARA